MTKQETIDLMQKIALETTDNPKVTNETWIIFFINEVYRQIVEPLEAALEAKEAVNQLYKGTVTLQGYDKADLIERVKKAENELAEVKEELTNTKLAYETQAVELGKLYDKYNLLQDQMKLQVAEASKLKKSLADEQMANGYYDALCQKNDELSRELAVYKCALKIASKEHMYLEILFEQTWLEQARKELEGKK